MVVPCSCAMAVNDLVECLLPFLSDVEHGVEEFDAALQDRLDYCRQCAIYSASATSRQRSKIQIRSLSRQKGGREVVRGRNITYKMSKTVPRGWGFTCRVNQSVSCFISLSRCFMFVNNVCVPLYNRKTSPSLSSRRG